MGQTVKPKINLFAVPFDSYTSKKTDEGMIYNIINKEGEIYAQCWVAHQKYANHDLLISNGQSAPSSTRNLLREHLNAVFGANSWHVITRFSVKQMRESADLQSTKFNNQAIAIAYDVDKGVLIDAPRFQPHNPPIL